MNAKSVNIVVMLVVVAIAILVVLGFFGIGGLSLFGVSREQAQTPAQELLQAIQQQGAITELQIQDVVVGSGEAVASGDTITVSYTGLLLDGTVFDSSARQGAPFTFTIGQGQVIEGWERGLIGMREGGRRLLAIPPSMGYGANAVGPIPPNSVLVFDVELLQRMSAGAGASVSP